MRKKICDRSYAFSVHVLRELCASVCRSTKDYLSIDGRDFPAKWVENKNIALSWSSFLYATSIHKFSIVLLHAKLSLIADRSVWLGHVRAHRYTSKLLRSCSNLFCLSVQSPLWLFIVLVVLFLFKKKPPAVWQLVRGQKQEGVGRMNWSKRRSAPWLLLMLRCDRMNNYSQILLVPPVMWKWKKYNLVNKRFPVDVLGESEKRDLWYWRY